MRLRFHETNPEIDDQIEALMDATGVGANRDIVRELIIASLKSGQEALNRADLKMMNMTIKEMRYTSKVFGLYQDRLRVTVFGSARTRPGTPLYELAVRFGRRLAENDFMVITGGGPGIMEAANRGAGSENSFAATIRLPFEQVTNEVVANSPRLIQYKYFFNRKIAFIKETHAIVLFPGGFGTLDEATEVMTLVQTGKQNPMPILLLETEANGYWENWIRLLNDRLAATGYISPEDLDLLTILNDESQAVSLIAAFYRHYHSMRYAGDLVVLRLKTRLGDRAVEQLNSEFSDCLLPGGSFERREALPEEQDEPAILALPRLTFPFNKKSFARLRAVIDRINTL